MKLLWAVSTLVLGSQAMFNCEYPYEYCGGWQQTTCDLGYDDRNCWMGQTCARTQGTHNCPVSKLTQMVMDISIQYQVEIGAVSSPIRATEM